MSEPPLCFIDGSWRPGRGSSFDVVNPYSGETIATVNGANQEDIAQAIATVHRQLSAGLPDPYERSEILMAASRLLEARTDTFRDSIVRETGFTRKDALGELSRAVQVLKVAAEEAKRLAGEVIPFSGAPGGSDRIGLTLYQPIGIVCAITPFNAPVSTVLHKLAPSFAAGNATLLKPAENVPGTAALLVQLLHDAGVAPGALQLLQGEGRNTGQALVEEPSIAYYAFTGSTEVGRLIQAGAGMRKTQMELGSISATIVCDDANPERAAQLCCGSTFRKAGQVCTSIQMLLVEAGIYDAFREHFLHAVDQLKHGDPDNDETDVGPVISTREADRIIDVFERSQASGGTLVRGGTRSGSVIAPTVFEDLAEGSPFLGAELFGPAVALVRVGDAADAVRRINATPYGLAAGAFTNNLQRGLAMARDIRVGGLHINNTSSCRVDLMPYGGVKDSGFGREGPKYAIREMMEQKLVTFTMEDEAL